MRQERNQSLGHFFVRSSHKRAVGIERTRRQIIARSPGQSFGQSRISVSQLVDHLRRPAIPSGAEIEQRSIFVKQKPFDPHHVPCLLTVPIQAQTARPCVNWQPRKDVGIA